MATQPPLSQGPKRRKTGRSPHGFVTPAGSESPKWGGIAIAMQSLPSSREESTWWHDRCRFGVAAGSNEHGCMTRGATARRSQSGWGIPPTQLHCFNSMLERPTASTNLEYGKRFSLVTLRAVLNGKKKKSVPEPVFPKKPAGTPCAQPWLVAVGGWWLAAVGGWQLATGGWWRLVVVGCGWWRLVVGGWWLVVGGPLGRSLAKKKKISSLKDRPGDTWETMAIGSLALNMVRTSSTFWPSAI